VKFDFIAKHRNAWASSLCETLGVSRSGFYAWLNRRRSQRSLTDERLGAMVYQSFLASDRTYGSRRVWHDVLALGQRCGLHKIERLMRTQALRTRPRRRSLPVDRGQRDTVAPNVLNRQFQADAPNQKWVADSPTSGLLKAGCMWPWFWIYILARGRLVHAVDHDQPVGHRCVDDGCVAAR
jgi:putative transposase